MKLKLLRWAVRAAIWIWPAYWIAQIFIGDLGASPAVELTHKLGTIVLALLTMNLVLGAVVDLWRPPPLWLRMWIPERRFWGISAFLILLMHIFFYFVNEGFEAKAFDQIYTKTYLIFATLAFVILLALALTSNNFSVRKLGARKWKRLHRTVYAVQLLLFGHILLIEKADLIFYGTWLGALLALQLVRFLVKVVRR
ncbi:MAG: ferric reductase-like transmembrane domain-containing protein [Bdellovibrionales bacterium]|nr:ferric reductase-like transmembrane domain-containing protein [Bdellovibrionales bacterium]